ncbi:MAG: hypothetical protein WCO56_11755 [Verrucomicrobiota bacterium]
MRFVIAAFCVVTAGLGASGVPGAEPVPPIVFGGPEALGKVTPHSAKAQFAERAMRVEFGKSDYPNVTFAAGKAYAAADCGNVGAIVFDVRNPGTTPIDVHVRGDATGNGEKFVRQGHLVVEPGERVALVWGAQPAPEGMKAGPPVETPPGARQMKVSGNWPAQGPLTAFQIFMNQPERPVVLEVHSIQFLPKAELTGIVDRYGQYTRAQWPGKVGKDEDLARVRAEEEAWLQAHPAPGDRDEYGGWQTGPQLKATGFFRVERVEGRWWLVTPKGRLFWSVGPTCVRPDSSGPVRGRETMFTWLPEGAAKRNSADFYQVNLARKYGESWNDLWVKQTAARLPAWGFNTIANWSHESAYAPHRVPFTATVSLGGLPAIGVRPAPGKPDNRLHDYFDESFPRKADDAIAKQADKWRDDPWCIGFFVDNEIHWDAWTAGGNEGVAARAVLASPPTVAARQALVKLLRAKYGTVGAMAKAWGITLTDWDQPVTLTAKQLNDAARADCSAFLAAMAERYFSVISAAMKKHAPDRLYLGCRFAQRPQEVVNVSVKYCDVVSFNIYNDTIDPKNWAYLNELGKPVIIGEFHFGATDRGMFHTGLRPTGSQAERAAAYAAYVRSACAMPALVGCHWFQYVDQPLTGRFDGENYNIGLVTVTDAPYPELRASARDVNAEVYRLHSAATAGK